MTLQRYLCIMGIYIYKAAGRDERILVDGEIITARRAIHVCKASFLDGFMSLSKEGERRRRLRRMTLNNIKPVRLLIPAIPEDESDPAKMPLENGMLCYLYASPRGYTRDTDGYGGGQLRILQRGALNRWEAVPPSSSKSE